MDRLEGALLGLINDHEGEHGVERLSVLVELAGAPAADVRRATRRLIESGHVVAIDASSNQGFEVLDIRLSPSGRAALST